MKLWVDAHISPAIARWIKREFLVDAYPLRELGLREADDEIIFLKAKNENVIFMTKDEDFVKLLSRFGSPPKVIWLTCGNTSNEELKKIFKFHFEQITKLFDSGEDLVEIGRI